LVEDLIEGIVLGETIKGLQAVLRGPSLTGALLLLRGHPRLKHVVELSLRTTNYCRVVPKVLAAEGQRKLGVTNLLLRGLHELIHAQGFESGRLREWWVGLLGLSGV
jgi:hypothetical protein